MSTLYMSTYTHVNTLYVKLHLSRHSICQLKLISMLYMSNYTYVDTLMSTYAYVDTLNVNLHL